MSVLDKYYRINQAAGIAIHAGAQGDIAIQLCFVSANGNELSIDKKIVDLTTISQLKQNLPDKSMIALNLSGKGILHKQIEKCESIDQQLFSKVLPNANMDDFYIQNFISGESSFVSVIRKTDADKWLGQLIQLGLKPLVLSLGPFPIANIIPLLNIYEDVFLIDGHQVKRNESKEWISYSYDKTFSSHFPLKLASENIDEKICLPYSIVFQLVLSNRLEPICVEAPTLRAALKKQLSDNRVKAQGVVILIAFFVLLLINYIVFSSLNASNSVLAERVNLNAQNTNSLQDISEQAKKKEGQLNTLGWDGGINKSALADQVASLLPKEIVISQIAINPIDQASSRTRKLLVFSNRKIQLIGNSQQIIPVNEWIARIKTCKWVKTIQMDSFTFDSELNTGRFVITINY